MALGFDSLKVSLVFPYFFHFIRRGEEYMKPPFSFLFIFGFWRGTVSILASLNSSLVNFQKKKVLNYVLTK